MVFSYDFEIWRHTGKECVDIKLKLDLEKMSLKYSTTSSKSGCKDHPSITDSKYFDGYRFYQCLKRKKDGNDIKYRLKAIVYDKDDCLEIISFSQTD